MVKFGNSLSEHAEAYSGLIDQEKYLDYEKLKQAIYNNPKAFLKLFEVEMCKLEHFLKGNMEEEMNNSCQEGCPCKIPEKQARIKFYGMNREGCRKILKKFDKETGETASGEYLRRVDMLYSMYLNEEELAITCPKMRDERLCDDASDGSVKQDSEPQDEVNSSEGDSPPAMLTTHHSSSNLLAQGKDQPYIKWYSVCGLQVGYLHRQVKSQCVNGEARITVGNTLLHTTSSCLVYDPQNKGRYIIPAILLEDTVGKRDYASKKQSFVCMLYQKGGENGHRGCNAHHACNQLHVSREAVKVLREMASSGQGYTVSTGSNFVVELRDVYDASTNAKYVLPYHRTEATLGRAFYARSRADPNAASPQLCLFYLEGKCRNGKNCRHIHADPPYIAKLRFGNPCCPMHHPDRATHPPVEIPIKVRWGPTQGGCFSEVPHMLITSTTGLNSLPIRNGKTGQYKCFANGKICRLHRENRCEYGEACNNIHICHSFVPKPEGGVVQQQQGTATVHQVTGAGGVTGNMTTGQQQQPDMTHITAALAFAQVASSIVPNAATAMTGIPYPYPTYGMMAQHQQPPAGIASVGAIAQGFPTHSHLSAFPPLAAAAPIQQQQQPVVQHQHIQQHPYRNETIHQPYAMNPPLPPPVSTRC
eukprot:TRINITY_DN20519_c0_g1_i2.p1 TRINITY_DN20519_c0_g1~~TRINITY_DN20519_c0_g1_i2.p1  ORF type:complete len:660 (+),score=240.86 TRINITY_DN20519_c0_g1_i2:45-1982(+)